MQCPNCGRNVRSKTQCAYCGYRFNAADKKENKKKSDSKEILSDSQTQTKETSQPSQRKIKAHPPQAKSLKNQNNDHSQKPIPRRSLEQEMKEAELEAQQAYSRTAKIEKESEKLDEDEEFKKRADEVFAYPYTTKQSQETFSDENDEYILPKTQGASSVFKKLIKLLIGLAILALLFFFGPQLFEQAKDWWDSKQSETVETTEEIISNQTSSEVASSTQETSDPTTGSNNETDNQTSEVEPAYHITKNDIDIEDYPRIKMTLSFAEKLADVNDDTFEFKVKYNETETPLEDNYTLEKVGQDILLSFVDPAVSVVGEDTTKQTLVISAENFSDAVEYKVPADDDNKQIKEALNQIVNDQLAGMKDISIFIQTIDGQVPYVYNDQVMNADQSIGWFVLQWIHELMAEGTVEPGQVIEVNDQLIASGDTGQVGTKVIPAFTLQDMINLVAMENDASAMNHLIQLAGGVNEFNLWLKKAGYFSTRMNAPLAIESGRNITGATTSGTDLGSLMLKLAKDKLFTGDLSSFNEGMKETLLLSPNTLKFPGENVNFGRRYEMMSSDLNNESQNYEGIIETPVGDVVVVIMAENIQSADSIIPTIRQIIEETLMYLINGQQEADLDNEDQALVQQETSLEGNDLAPQNDQPVVTSISDTTSNSEHLSPSGEPVDTLYEGKQTEKFYWFGDQYRRGTWYLGEDGGWYFR